ncbi:CpsD/CapB family tyrosine-protein kinase [Gorillibacterium sp. sgz500922]|uniref:CpsD/CapB family tyrosine-protein kinase n=1 Tax=Gorillibacterium sp. sgz500922 TaxID=3446694 RepID=UPI003F66FE2C
MRQPTVNRPLVMETNPASHVAEAYRTLRTNISFSSVDRAVQLILVNSALPGEGKSTTAANLAAAYAQAGKKTLILDADLRRPAVHRVFQATNRPGLSGVLSRQAELSEAIRPTGIENLDLIASGPVPPNPAELLGSQRMRSLLEELRSEYEVIIVDTPPTLAVADAQLLASLADGVLLVLDSGRIKRDYVKKAKASLEHAGARILGVVLNGVVDKERGSYRYGYGSAESS